MSQSRGRQQSKRLHRREKKDRQQRRHFRQRLEQMQRGEAPHLRLLSYDITCEAMPEAGHGGKRVEDVLGFDDRQELFERLTTDPQWAIPRLRDLVERHPEVPVFYNWLSVAHQAAKEYDAMDRTSQLLYERHPQYLFGRFDVARLALESGDLARFEAIFEKQFDLKLLYPWRSVFHISEFLGFASLMVQYYIRTERHDAAEKLLSVMEQMAPDSDQTVHARQVLEHVGLLQVLEEAIGRLAEPRKRRRKKPAAASIDPPSKPA